MTDQERNARFEQIVLPHLDAAYNLARWLIHDERDAEDVVQEACLRAFKFVDGFRGGDSRAWMLRIVRNTCYSWLRANREAHESVPFEETLSNSADDEADPEAVAFQEVDTQTLRRALEEMPVEFREVIILRELEGLSYKEIASITDVPIGTVMSRLARARQWLQHFLLEAMRKETRGGLPRNAHLAARVY
ncbi:MAG: sigma-70 family RNA polymerase sigma factor [Anaerolineae bacterium]